MNEKDIKALIAIPIVLLITTLLAIAGSQGSYSTGNISIFAICVIIAIGIQWVAFIPAYLKRTEKFYDLTGGITYITVIWIAALLSDTIDTRSKILLVVISIWALRLSLFLFRRVHKAGEDKRFRELKSSFSRFLLTWTMQGLWVAFTLAAALAAITSETRKDLDVFAILGVIIWIIGFGIEVVSDRQKGQFRSNPENKNKFINTGLWSRSRHPNYFGEIVLWIGVTLIAIPVLQGWQWVTLISPIFVYLLLTLVSGVPLLEVSADKKWGGQPEYEEYKSNTPILFPRR